ncbi:MAG: putative Ig domain-containing protein, partial [Pseudomonadales bacterium]
SVAKVIQVSTQGTVTGPPRIKQMAALSNLQNTAVDLALVISDPDGDALNISASGLPDGLLLNSTSGIISGTPTTAGTYNVTINVADGSEGSDSTSFVWTILDASNPPGLYYEYYQGNWDVLPDFDALTALSTGTVANVTLAPRTQDDFFGFRFTGRVLITTPGDYTFYTNSDDGSQLFIDDVLIVENDGLHGPRERQGNVSLAAGLHKLSITFFEKGGGANLSASWSGPGITKTAIPNGALRLPAAQTSGRFLRLVALSEINGNPWSSAAELNLLDANGQALNRAGWVASASSEETASESGVIGNAFDGNANTIWHTEWSTQPGDDLDPAHPHEVIIDMGSSQSLSGLRYLPRTGAGNGTIAQYAIYLSDSSSNWGVAIAQGTFAPDATEKAVLFSTAPPNNNNAPTVVSPGNQSSLLGDTVSLLISASDADGQALVYSATDLPAGLAMNSATGLISGTTSAIGSHTTTVIVDDGADSATASFSWEVNGVNIAPTLSAIASRSGVVGDQVNVTPQASDANGDVLTFTASGLPAGTSIDANSGVISGMLSSPGGYSVTVTVSDGALSDASSFNWSVAQANSAPVLSAIANQSSEQNEAVSVTLAATDPDGDALTFSATGLPAGTTIDSSSGLISGAASTAGNYSVTASVTDGALSASRTFAWTVTAPAQPIVIAALSKPPQAVNRSVAYSASASGTGPLEYRWSFADGSTPGTFSSSASTTHTFTTPGRYLVTLDVRNAFETASITFTQAVHGTHTAVRARNSSTIVVDNSSGLERIWNVNPDNNSVSVIDASSQTLIAEIAVGEQPVALASNGNGQIWVSNQQGNSISRIDAAALAVVSTIELATGAAPYGILFDAGGESVYIATEGLQTVQRRDSNGATTASIAVGPNVRALALSGDGATLYATRFITPPLPGEHTQTVATTQGGNPLGGEVLTINTATNSVSGTVVLGHSDAVISEHSGPGLPNYLRAPVVSPDGVTAYVPSKQDNVLGGALRDGVPLTHDHTVRAISSRLDLGSGSAPVAARIDHDNASIAAAAAFDGSGNYLFVALEGNRMVAAVDAYRGEELFRFFSGRAPSGLTMGNDGSTLYVHNFMDRTVSVHDLSTFINTGDNVQALNSTISVVSAERLPSEILLGKQHFYDALDPRLALESYMACASCHSEGDSDGRTWDFTQFGEGLRNTSTLIGQGGAANGPVHWTGNFDEIQDFEGQIRSFARGLGLMADADFNSGSRNTPLGDPKAGLSSDLDALAAYITSLNDVGHSPNRPDVGVHSSAGQIGASLFVSEGCSDCHSGALFSDSAASLRHDVGTQTAASGLRLGAALDGFDTPALKGLWRTAPYLHDGSAPTLAAAISAHVSGLAADDLESLAAYVSELDDSSLPDTGTCADCIDFSAAPTVSYSTQDVAGNLPGSVTVNADGSALTLTNNTWRRTDFTYNVASDTVLEFDVRIDQAGEIHGIGFDTNDSINQNRTFRIHGSQRWGLSDFADYSSGTVSYRIPVGQFYTGSNLALFFVNDYDSGAGNSTTWSNVRIYRPTGNSAPLLSNVPDQTSTLGSGISLSLSATDLDGDNLTFSASALPPGLQLESSTGIISGAPSQAGSFAVTATVSDGTDEHSVSFNWSITDGACGSNCVDFSVVDTESYAAQDFDSGVAVSDGGVTLTLTGNTWRRTLTSYNITPGTVLEFQFASSQEGEIHGIGFDADNRMSSDRIFKVHGTQGYGIRAYDNYSGSGTQIYRIPVGQYYTGTGMRMVLVNDRDAGTGIESRFSNVRLFEE